MSKSDTEGAPSHSSPSASNSLHPWPGSRSSAEQRQEGNIGPTSPSWSQLPSDLLAEHSSAFLWSCCCWTWNSVFLSPVKRRKAEQLFGAIPPTSLHPKAVPRSEQPAERCHGYKTRIQNPTRAANKGERRGHLPALQSTAEHPLLCLGAAERANWEALINGQCLLLTQVVLERIKAAAFMEVSLIEL